MQGRAYSRRKKSNPEGSLPRGEGGPPLAAVEEG